MDNNNNLKEFLRKNGFSIAICSTVAILLVATLYFSYKGFEGYEQKNIVKDDKDDKFEAVNKSDVKSYKATKDDLIESTTEKKQIQNQTEKVSEQSSEQTTQKIAENSTQETSNNEISKNEPSKNDDKKEEANIFNMFDESQEMSWPVSGQIVMDFSTETAIYDKTLDQYRTNNSICISAPEGTDVKASAEGVIENIFADNENGKTIVINHGNGWLSTYSQLQEEVNVAVGDIVKEGELIGKIGAPSNYSVKLGSHLNFKVSKDNVYSDPKLVLEQIEE